MKVTFGDLITSGSGSAGGHTYSRNKGGAYRKNKGIPTQPQSEKQMLIRTNLANFSAQWRGLSDDQRNAWNQAAKNVKLVDALGRTFNPTGHNYFVALNQTLQMYLPQGLPSTAPTLTDPPIAPDFVSWNSIAVLQTSGPLAITLQGDYAPVGSGSEYLEVWGTEAMSAGISNPGSKYKYLCVASGSGGATSFNFASFYSDVFGVPTPGQKVFIRVRPTNILTGQTGIFQSTNFIAV